ncbi:hypothetical protein VRK_28210 [Vibrio sp. MEBiC08052]|nr:hypothetical protein VRK_28210 [Vibrio sp. MEBiC08052]
MRQFTYTYRAQEKHAQEKNVPESYFGYNITTTKGVFMSVSALQSGYQMIDHATQMTNEASRDLNRVAQHRSDEQIQQEPRMVDSSPAPQQNTIRQQKEIADKNPDQTQVDALMKLNQATQYNRVGANVIQREQDMIGSLLNIQV